MDVEKTETFKIYNTAINKFYNNLDRLESKLREKKIYIFGTSTPSCMMLSYLNEKQIQVEGFLDNNISRTGTRFRNKEVFYPSEVLSEYNPDILVLIVSGFQKQMIKQILSFGYTENNVEIVLDINKEMNDYSHFEHNTNNQLSESEMKKYQIDILKKLDDVCRANGLRYYLAFGTLLGAVRHKGFIPWDDDIDIYMPAEDIIKLRKILEKDSRFKMITQYDDYVYFGQGCCLMINNEVTSDINRFPIQLSTGISIDIFSLYGLPDENIDKYIAEIRRMEAGVLDAMYSEEKYKKNLNKLNEYLLSYSYDSSKKIGSILFPGYERMLYDKKDFGEGIELNFEDGCYICPKEYKKILEMYYGDFMTLPPEEERKGWHYNMCYYNK